MELWKDIPGYEGLYQASTLGRIKSLPRNTTHGVILKQRRVGPRLNYLAVGLWKEGYCHPVSIHRLVALTFLSTIEDKTTVDHIDRNPLNNRLDNLRWANQSEQNINSNRPIGVSGLRNIRPHGNRWDVYIIRDSITAYRKSFATLEEAIFTRDAVLATLEAQE